MKLINKKINNRLPSLSGFEGKYRSIRVQIRPQIPVPNKMRLISLERTITKLEFILLINKTKKILWLE